MKDILYHSVIIVLLLIEKKLGNRTDDGAHSILELITNIIKNVIKKGKTSG